MNDIHRIGTGLAILEKYGEKEVNADSDRTIYAGPEMSEDEFDEADRINLKANMWFFSDDTQRWAYNL